METGEYLSDDTGRCDREVNCGYHKTPHEHFEETNSQPEKSYWFPKKELRKPLHPSGFSTINHTLVEESMNNMAFNNFNIWLRVLFPDVIFLTTGGITNLRPETKLRLEDFIK